MSKYTHTYKRVHALLKIKRGLKIACVEYEKTQRGVSDLEMRLASVNRNTNASFFTAYNRPSISVLDGKVTTTLSLIFSFHPFIVSLLPLTHTFLFM